MTGDGPLASNREESQAVSVSRGDLITLTKARLSLLVLVTTFFGFLLASKGAFQWMLLVHTLVGTGLTAFGSAVFNQLMEIDSDARMKRTSDRPLPAGRVPTSVAFLIGWVLAGFGIVHLALKVNFQASFLAAVTLIIYLFVYTPMKRKSSLNTLVGGVAGAIPPVIGWVAGGGGYGVEAWFLFGLLFLWQLPHFVAINWMYREEYVRGGFVMWSNDDESGAKTSGLALVFSVMLTALLVVPYLCGFGGWVSLVGGVLLGLVMVGLSLRFRRERDRGSARRLFFYTLMYLPLVFVVLVISWR
ncbi:MAG: heme o synthase [Verrucomicrobiota bacterium]